MCGLCHGEKSAAIADDTQKSQTALIEAVLETIQGMSVVKSFNLTGKGDKKLQDALEYNRRSNLEVESVMTPYTAVQEAVLQIAGTAMMLAAVLFWINGSMTLANALMTLIVSFLIFSQVKLFGMGVSMLRLAGAAIDRTMETEQMPQMEDRLQKAIEALTNHKTILMIAHWLKTVRSADQILVLDQGRITQRGTHEQLIQQDGIYRRFISGREEVAGWKL